MEEAFNNVNVQDFKLHLTENKHEHTAIVSKKSTSHREYSVNLPKSTTLGSRFGKCTCGFPKKEGIPRQHLVAVCKLGRIDGLSRSAIMPLTQPSYREVGVRFKRVGDIKVVKHRVKSYITILSGQCAVVGGIFTTALS